MTSSLTHTVRARLAALDAAPLVAFLAPALLLLAFFGIADEMAEGDTHTLDRAVLEALRTPGAPHDPVGPAWLDAAIVDLTSLGSTSVLTLVTLLAIGFLLLLKRHGAALTVALAAGGGAMLATLLKSTFERPRPEFIAHGVAIDAWSFPSGHAMLSAVIYLTLGAMITQATPRRRLRFYMIGAGILLTLIVGASRVYLGVHYPSDVLAGWSVGAAWALACRAVAAQFSASERGPASQD